MQELILYIIIREFLTTNLNVKVVKDNFYLVNKSEEIKGSGQTYYIHFGYKLSLK
jgi:hypothetical protein